MSPRNFPGKINDRRKSALVRIEHQLASGTKRVFNSVVPLESDDVARLREQANRLALRIKPDHIARAIRTKINRSGSGKIARAA
jgi:hypothetical protein